MKRVSKFAVNVVYPRVLTYRTYKHPCKISAI